MTDVSDATKQSNVGISITDHAVCVFFLFSPCFLDEFYALTGMIAGIAVSRCRYLLLVDILGPVSDRPVDQVMPCGLAPDLRKADLSGF